MARILVALAAGLIFGAGLAVSDMVNPARVLAFLDLAGDWDPALAFVMGGAVIPAAVAFGIARKAARPLLDSDFHIPKRRDIDARLVTGAVMFGIGWGLVGLCPGPAVGRSPSASGRFPFSWRRCWPPWRSTTLSSSGRGRHRTPQRLAGRAKAGDSSWT